MVGDAARGRICYFCSLTQSFIKCVKESITIYQRLQRAIKQTKHGFIGDESILETVNEFMRAIRVWLVDVGVCAGWPATLVRRCPFDYYCAVTYI